MTVQSEVSRVNYSGDDSTVAFSTTFYFLANADLRVIIRDANGTETVQVTGTDYSVTGAGNANGGTVTFVSAPASGETVVIIRDPPLTQLTDYNDQDPFPADSHERALDKLTMLISRLAEKFARSVLLQETSTLTDLVFPNPEAGKFFRWNGDADGIENATFVGDTEALPATASRYLRRNDDGDAFSALSATQSANLDAIRDMGIGSQVEFTDAANDITAAHSGQTLIANRGSAISFDFDPVANLGVRFWVLIKNEGAGTLTINPDGAETVDGSASRTVAQGDALLLMGDGSALRSALPLDIKMSRAGGTFSGAVIFSGATTFNAAATFAAALNMADNALNRPFIADYAEKVNAIGSIGGGTQDIDLELGNVVTGTVDTAETTFTFSNPPATGRCGSFTLILTNGGSQTVNWPASVKWPSGDEPTLTPSGVDIMTFFTVDAGANWYGFPAGLGMA